MFSSNLSMPELTKNQLKTIVNRELINLEEDHRCSVTLSTRNVFLCLSCGKYFCGGSNSSPLTQHFVNEFHPIALRLIDNKIITLPDYEPINDTSAFNDILFTSKPVYDQNILKIMHEKMKNSSFNDIPGFIGLESLKSEASKIAVLRFISCIEPLRDYLLLNDFKENELINEFALFFKRFFNPYYYKKVIGIDRLLKILPDIDDPFIFLSAILNSLEKGFGKNNILGKLLRGKLMIETDDETGKFNKPIIKKIWMLPLEMNDSPLYRTGLDKEKIIPQTDLKELLKRFDGTTIIETPSGNGNVERKKMKMMNSPQYLILHLNRIKKNEFNMEKNYMHIILPNGKINMSEYGADADYHIVSIISHEGTCKDGFYLTYSKNKDSYKWVKCHPIDIEETLEEVAFLSQSCFILFEKVQI